MPHGAEARLPVHLAYGFRSEPERDGLEHRFSVRGAWKGQIHLGTGLTRWPGNDGWSPLWVLGADIGPYSLSVLRESLANGFGAIHFYRVAIRFP